MTSSEAIGSESGVKFLTIPFCAVKVTEMGQIGGKGLTPETICFTCPHVFLLQSHLTPTPGRSILSGVRGGGWALLPGTSNSLGGGKQ